MVLKLPLQRRALDKAAFFSPGPHAVLVHPPPRKQRGIRSQTTKQQQQQLWVSCPWQRELWMILLTAVQSRYPSLPFQDRVANGLEKKIWSAIVPVIATWSAEKEPVKLFIPWRSMLIWLFAHSVLSMTSSNLTLNGTFLFFSSLWSFLLFYFNQTMFLMHIYKWIIEKKFSNKELLWHCKMLWSILLKPVLFCRQTH